jgi:hypothetical protein
LSSEKATAAVRPCARLIERETHERLATYLIEISLVSHEPFVFLVDVDDFHEIAFVHQNIAMFIAKVILENEIGQEVFLDRRTTTT